MDRGLDWLRKRKAKVEVGAKATEEETGEVRVKEARAEAMIEEDQRKQGSKDLKLLMREVEAGQMTEWIRTPNKEAWIEEVKRKQSDRDLPLQMIREETGQKKEPGQKKKT